MGRGHGPERGEVSSPVASGLAMKVAAMRPEFIDQARGVLGAAGAKMCR
jgi:hypothetical protein